MADGTQGDVRNNGRGSGRHARARAAAFALPGPFDAAIAQARAASAHARAYQHAMVYARIRAYLSLAVKSSGLLALFLSSVILLGGFIEPLNKLGKKDFWCVTAITVIQAAGIFEDWENSMDRLGDFLETIGLLLDKLTRALRSFVLGRKLKGLLLYQLGSLLVLPFLITIMCLQLIIAFGPLASAAISAWRIAKLNHGTDSVMAALDLFYSLIIFQGTMFLVLFLVYIGELPMVRHLRALDELPSDEWAEAAILEYLSDINKKCRKNPLSIKGTDLIRYAVELLDSESQEEYLYVARLLSVFIKKQSEDVRSLLLPSTHKIQKLIESLRISSSLDEASLEFSSILDGRCLGMMSNLDDKREIRELAATIVADLARHMDLAKYPESMRYISSLLQEETTHTYRNIKRVPYPQRTIERLIEEEQWRQDFEKMPQRPIGPMAKREQRRHDYEELEKRRDVIERMVEEERRQWKLAMDQKRMTRREERRPKNREGDASYELILQGLTILDRLASNKDNCSLICSAPGLLPKITAPLYSETLIQDVTNKAWSEIVTRSLKLLHKLIRAPESISMSLRQDISSNGQALSNLKGILNMSSEAAQELQLPAMEILTEMALDFSINLDRETKEPLITKQRKVFLDNGEGGESATISGSTLVSLSENNSDLIMNPRKDITDCLAKSKEIHIKKQLQVFLANAGDEESAAMAGRTLVFLSSNSESNCALIMRTQGNIIGCLTAILYANNIIRRTIAAEIMENMCAHSDVDKQYMKKILLPKVLKEIISFKRESHERKLSPGQNNSASGDEENQRDSKSGKVPAWYYRLLPGMYVPVVESTAYQNNLCDQGSEEQEAFLSLTLAICNKLNSADDFDDAIEHTVGREEFVDKLKSIINDNWEATPGSLRIVKLCGRIAESMMQCQQYQQYAEHFRNKGFESLLSEASKTMSRLESCMLFHGTDFGLKKTVRPLISDIQLERKSNLELVERTLQEYLEMYNGPLPAEIIAALTATFNLDDEEEKEMDAQLVGNLGGGVSELEDAAEIVVA